MWISIQIGRSIPFQESLYQPAAHFEKPGRCRFVPMFHSKCFWYQNFWTTMIIMGYMRICLNSIWSITGFTGLFLGFWCTDHDTLRLCMPFWQPIASCRHRDGLWCPPESFWVTWASQFVPKMTSHSLQVANVLNVVGRGCTTISAHFASSPAPGLQRPPLETVELLRLSEGNLVFLIETDSPISWGTIVFPYSLETKRNPRKIQLLGCQLFNFSITSSSGLKPRPLPHPLLVRSIQ